MEPTSYRPLTKESIRQNNFVVEWEALEYQHKIRSSDWYWIVGITAGTAAVISLLLGNALFSLIIILGVGILMVYAAKPPETITISITIKGVRVNDRLFPFTNIKSFSIADHDHGPVLILDINKAILPLMVLPIDSNNINLEMLSQYLEVFIPEGSHHLPIVEILAERLGF